MIRSLSPTANRSTESDSAGMSKRRSAGFSLTELLAVLAIMTLVGMVVATCIPSAHRAYIGTTDASNAQVLLSTTSTRLRDVLSVADPKSIERKTASSGSAWESTTFRSMETGYTVEIKNGGQIGSGDNVVTIKGLTMKETNAQGKTATNGDAPLVPVQLAKTKDRDTSKDMYVNAGDISYVDGVFTVKDLQVYRGNDQSPIGEKIDALKVRVLAA